MRKLFYISGFCLFCLLSLGVPGGECADARIGQTIAGIEALSDTEKFDVVLKRVRGAVLLIEEYCGQKRFDDAFKIRDAVFGLQAKYGTNPQIAFEFARALARLCDAFAREDRLDEALRFYLELSALRSSFPGDRDIAGEEAWVTQNLSWFYIEHKNTDEQILQDAGQVREVVLSRLASPDAVRSVNLMQTRAARNLLLFYCGADRGDDAAKLYDALAVVCRDRVRDREFALEHLYAASNMTWFYGVKGRPLDAVSAFTDAVVTGSLIKSDANVGAQQLMSAQNLLLGYENAKDLKTDDIGPAYTAYGFVVSLRAAFDAPVFADAERQSLYRLIVANCNVGNLSRAQSLFRQFVDLYADEEDRDVCRYEATAVASLLELMTQKESSDSARQKADDIYALVQPLRLVHIDDATITLQEARAAHSMLKLSGRTQAIEEALNFYYRVAALGEAFPDSRDLAIEQIQSAISMFGVYSNSSRAIESLEFSRVTRIYADVVALQSRFADDVEIAYLRAKAACALFRLCRGVDEAVIGNEPKKLAHDLDVLYRAFPSDFFYRLLM